MAKLNANSVELGSLTTTQRNALTSVSTGTVIYNTSNSQIEVWDGNQWIGGLTTPLAATGGTTDSSTRPGYIVHTFTGDGTFTVTSGSGTAEYLLVAGGGGGGARSTGTGGSGGSGVGGDGDGPGSSQAGSGERFTGSGGGGGGNAANLAGGGGNGASGIVIISYPT